MFGQKLKLLNDVSEQVIDEIDAFKGNRYMEPFLDHFLETLANGIYTVTSRFSKKLS